MALNDDSFGGLDNPWSAQRAAPTLDVSKPVPLAPAQPVQSAAPAVAQPKPAAQPGAKITPETHPHFFNAPRSEGAPADYVSATRKRESGGDDHAWNGVAGGRYGFTPQTFLGVAKAHPELGLTAADFFNGDKQDLAMRAFTDDNVKLLEGHGIAPDPANLAMVHFLGVGAGPKFLKAMQTAPQSSAAQMFPLEARYNPTIFFSHGDPNQPRTLAGVYDVMAKSVHGATLGGAPSEVRAPGEPQAGPAQVAQGPETTMIDASTPPAEAELPPLPSGFKPIAQPEATKLPPLPSGFKPIAPTQQEIYRQLVDKNPYEQEAAKDKTPEQEMVERTDQALVGHPPSVSDFLSRIGGIIGASPGYDASIVEGLGSGALQAGTGLGETVGALPGLGPLGDASAAATRTLQGYGDPQAQTLGTLGVGMAPVGRVAGGVKSLVEEGPSIARFVKNVATGAGGGALAGAEHPTGEIDPEKRARDKLKDVMIGAGAGGVASGAAPAVAGAAKWAAKELSDAWGSAAKRAAEELRTGVSADTGKALSEEDQAAHVAALEKRAAQMRAKGEEEATVAQEKKAAQAEAARAAAVAEHAAKPTTNPEDLGIRAHLTLAEDVADIKKIRAEKSGFDKAVKSDQGQPSVPTSKFITDSRLLEAQTKSPELKAALKQFRSSLTNAAQAEGDKGVTITYQGQKYAGASKLEAVEKAQRKTGDDQTRIWDAASDAEAAGQKTAAPKSGKPIEKLSIEQSREVLATLNRNVSAMYDAGQSNAAKKLEAIRDEFMGHLETTHPQLKAARAAYAEHSKPLNEYEQAGVLKGDVRNPYTGETKLDPTKIKDLVLAKTDRASDSLKRLIARNPALRDDVRGVFQQQLYGSGATAKTPSAAQIRAFIEKNRLPLEGAGLKDEFEAMLRERQAVDATAENEGLVAKEMRSAGRPGAPGTAETQKTIKDLAAKKTDAMAARKQFDDLDTRLAKARTPREVVAEATRAVEAINKSGRLSKEQYGEAIDKLKNVEQKVSDHERAAALSRQIVRAMIVAGLGAGGYELGHYVSHRISP